MNTYIKDELNVKVVKVSADAGSWVTWKAIPDNKVLGRRLGKAFKNILPLLKQLSVADIQAFQRDGKLSVGEVEVLHGEMEVQRVNAEGNTGVETEAEGGAVFVYDMRLTEELKTEGEVREVAANTQRLRKAGGLQVCSTFGSALCCLVICDGHERRLVMQWNCFTAPKGQQKPFCLLIPRLWRNSYDALSVTWYVPVYG